MSCHDGFNYIINEYFKAQYTFGHAFRTRVFITENGYKSIFHIVFLIILALLFCHLVGSIVVVFYLIMKLMEKLSLGV